jgi:hypothetical protein
MHFNIVNAAILLAFCSFVASRTVPLAEATETKHSHAARRLEIICISRYTETLYRLFAKRSRILQGIYGETISSIERRVLPIEPPRIPGSPKPGRRREPGEPSAPK